MYTPAELIDALRRRRLRSLRPEASGGEFPPGWREWFAGLRDRVGAVRGAAAEAIVSIFLSRALRPPPARTPALSDWQAFNTLWRQEWHPSGADSRGQRIAAMAITLVLELVLAIFLLWLAYARWGGAPTPAGDEVVQVEFIGKGTPIEQGGGAPAGTVPQPAAAAAAEPAAAAAAPAGTPPPVPASSAGAPAVAQAPSPPVPPPAASSPTPTPVETLPPPQPLQVTQVPVPDSRFTLRVPDLVTEAAPIEVVELPSAPERSVSTPATAVRVPELDATVQALPTPVPPLPQAPARVLPTRQARVQVPAMEAQVQALPGAVAPLPDAARQAVPSSTPELRVPGLADGVAALPMPGAAGQGEAAPAAAHSPAAAAGQGSAAQAGGRTAATGGVQGDKAGAGAGPRPGERAGAWQTDVPGSDWGVADRNRPGAQAGGAGLFDGDGRVKLPPGTVGGAADVLGPDGVLETEIADLDRAGTWLKRPPIHYEPTRFDRYWIPGGTLLQEWVRRGIREVAIRIPGTSKKIHCTVSLLQLGGGCGIDDPNMQDQEATARPAPEIPWKPELQEDQDAL